MLLYDVWIIKPAMNNFITFFFVIKVIEKKILKIVSNLYTGKC